MPPLPVSHVVLLMISLSTFVTTAPAGGSRDDFLSQGDISSNDNDGRGED
jgi:hypothetical protein